MARDIAVEETSFGRIVEPPRITNLVCNPIAGDDGTTTETAALTATVGFVGLFPCHAYIKAEKIGYEIHTAGVGTVVLRAALYAEDGTLLGQGTDACGTNTGIRRLTLDAPVLLKPGNYYVLFTYVSGTSGPTLDTHDCGTYQATLGATVAAVPEVFHGGTVVCVAGAAPSPLGTITPVASHLPICKLIGQA